MNDLCIVAIGSLPARALDWECRAAVVSSLFGHWQQDLDEFDHGRPERHDVDRVAGRPFQEVVDEVQEPGVGPLEILEDEQHRVIGGDPLEDLIPEVLERNTAVTV